LGPAGQTAGAVLDGIGYKAKEAFDVAGRNGRGLAVLLAGSVLGSITAVGGGMIALANHAAEVGSAIGTASTKTGISATQMSGLYALTKETGGSFEALTTSLSRAGANLEKTAEGGGHANKMLWDLMGGARGAAELGLKPMGDRIQGVLHSIFALHDAGQRNLALNQLLGRGWSENVITLRLLAMQGYAPAIEQAKKLGVYFDAGRIAQAKQYQVAVREMTAQWSAFTLTLGGKVIPLLNRTMIGMQGMGGVIAHTVALLGAVVTSPFEGAKGIMEEWASLKKAYADSVQAQTDYEVNLQSLTTGQQAATEHEDGLVNGIKAHSDALAALIERERDEVSELGIHGNKFREIQAEYDRTLREIDKQVQAGGNLAEAYTAQTLALDIYKRKIQEYIDTAVKVPKLPLWGESFAAAGGAPEIDFTKKMIPSVPGMGGLTQGPALDLTAQQEANLGTETDRLRGYFKALEQETQLSDSSFKRLADTFPGLTTREIAANAEGQKLIAWLTRLDRLGANMSFGDSLKTQLEEIKIAGDDAGAHLVSVLTRSLDSIEDAFARLVVTGKGGFKQLAQGMEESFLKIGMQKAVSGVLGKLGVGGGFSKADGSQGNPFYVRFADAVKGLLAGGAGAQGDGASGGVLGADASGGGVRGALSGIGGAIGGALKAFGPALSTLGSWFGGFLAGGGDVTPGHAYVVGEKHPEFFVPHASGTVVPSLAMQSLRPLHYAPVYNISTPDANSFKRSQQQLLTDGWRTMQVLHGRNS
jgi:hypothetical protein